MFPWSALLLVLADAPQPQLLSAGVEPESVATSQGRVPGSIWGPYPVSKRDPRSIERMTRRITTARLVRVRASQGTFIGHVADVRIEGLYSLAPDSTRSWSGPVDLLSWDDIRTIEVRRRSPVLTTGAGMGIGLAVGVTGGLLYANQRGGSDVAAGFLFGLAGAVAGAPIGFAVGTVVHIWEPLYRAP